jgi:hypothetical protein
MMEKCEKCGKALNDGDMRWYLTTRGYGGAVNPTFIYCPDCFAPIRKLL